MFLLLTFPPEHHNDCMGFILLKVGAGGHLQKGVVAETDSAAPSSSASTLQTVSASETSTSIPADGPDSSAETARTSESVASAETASSSSSRAGSDGGGGNALAEPLAADIGQRGGERAGSDVLWRLIMEECDKMVDSGAPLVRPLDPCIPADCKAQAHRLFVRATGPDAAAIA